MNTYYLTQDSKGKWSVTDSKTEDRVTTNAIETYLKFLNKKPKKTVINNEKQTEEDV
jgi:hypothetical protein